MVGADEALAMGLLTAVVAAGDAPRRALELAEALAGFPQATMLADRRAAIEGLGPPLARRARARGAARPPTSSTTRCAAPGASPPARAAAGRAPGIGRVRHATVETVERSRTMTYFVTGATGFIGRHLVEELLEARRRRSTSSSARARASKLDDADREPLGRRATAIKPVIGDLRRAALGVDRATGSRALRARSTTSSTSRRSTT